MRCLGFLLYNPVRYVALGRLFSCFCAAAGCSAASPPERSPSRRGHACQGGRDAALPTRQVLTIKKEVNPAELNFLLRFPSKAGVVSPVDFLQPQGWGGIKVGLCRCGGRGEAEPGCSHQQEEAAARLCPAVVWTVSVPRVPHSLPVRLGVSKRCPASLHTASPFH